MAKSSAKKLQQKYLTHILLILLFLILSSMVSFVVIFYLPTAGWLTYRSNKVPLTFRYPKDWPVSECSEPILFPQMKIEEVISFEKECDWRQSLNSIGDITVEKLDEVTRPKDFVSPPIGHSSDAVYNVSSETMKIGNKTGYLSVVTPKTNTSLPQPPISRERNYYVKANNLVYKIRLSGAAFYKGNKEETIKTFEKMLKTFQF